MNSNLAYSPAFHLLNDDVGFEVWQNDLSGEKALISKQHFQPGDIVCGFSAGTFSRSPTYLTVQVDIEKHITLQPDFLQYVNHGCNPNVFFDTTSFKLLCIKEIAANDELTFFYPSTEWEMNQPFACRCQSANCLKYISGAAHLAKETLSQYRLTDFITRQLQFSKP